MSPRFEWKIIFESGPVILSSARILNSKSFLFFVLQRRIQNNLFLKLKKIKMNLNLKPLQYIAEY